MDLPGEAYLFNLSLVTITFSAVSALVMLIRQSMGSGLTRFDIHLIATYISYGFVLTVIALLPPLLSLFELAPNVLWTIASGLAFLLFMPVLISVVLRRRKSSKSPAPLAVKSSFVIHGIANLIFLANAVIGPWQGIHLYATALTVSVATVMWMFARRIASLFSEVLIWVSAPRPHCEARRD
jgi:hypothetical protein